MINISGLVKSYDGVKAVAGLDLEIPDGQIFGFIGPNGAGKTTTIKMIAGILRPDSGSIRIDGISVQNDPLVTKSMIGYVPDTPDLYDRLTGMQFINFVADAFRVPQDLRRSRLEELAEVFEMRSALPDLIEGYSHGMRQKTALIAALVHDPKLWLLDEPLVGLDPKAAFTLKKMMRSHADAGSTVFFSTHVLEVAEKLCDRVGIIVKGELVKCGTMDQLRQEADTTLEKVFLELVG